LAVLASYWLALATHHRRMAAKASSKFEARLHLDAAERWDKEARAAWLDAAENVDNEASPPVDDG